MKIVVIKSPRILGGILKRLFGMNGMKEKR